ncbi:ring-1,2-phenylacetyl-CoA epoxidase subunit PaaE [Ruegeria halocynthiae]|uniref:Ring-1,2-phenylacetyl-CoA epoxidase subunit PaaE n=1 Tax=Ruegeria halocynthiae TaxID=985054 RepID=A0A1H3E475_9RHOB|nr:ferredoxin--NADP reductase [Ruegeria halocynthiae]SDX72719.1 ring-1,2-phenylacetyl-CoA epoxidase subunit PaaE [Ruegeria halocynthiae]
MQRNFHALTVSEIRKDIDGAATNIMFDVPPALKDLFEWTSGQHLTIRLRINGEEHRRSYTISNPPGSALRITLKRVKGGIVSNHIGDTLSAGDTVDIMPPFGQFTLIPGKLNRRTHYFYGAGSGITPLYAMIRSVLTEEPHSSAHLVFGNTDANSIMLRDEIEQMQAQYPQRFSVRHVLSRPALLSWFLPWRTGRLNAEAIQVSISETPPVAQDTQYWICGPGKMNSDVRSALLDLDVPDQRIHMESFGGDTESDMSVSGVEAEARIELNGATFDVPVRAGETILDAARSAGLNPPFSCQSGVCGACVALLQQGTVHMRNRMALEDDDISKGLILSCQSIATQDKISVRFENKS